MNEARADLAVICTAGAVALVLVSSLIDSARFHAKLVEARKLQTAGLENTHRAELQLDALAKGTQALADEGNPNARAILAVLRQNGVQIRAGS